MKTKFKNEKILQTLFAGKGGKQYFGKQVVMIGNKATILPADRKKATKLIENLEKQYPGEIPQLAFIPRPETYIFRFFETFKTLFDDKKNNNFSKTEII